MQRTNTIFRVALTQSGINSSIFREIVKRLQAFGLITLQIENTKITDNVFLQLNVFDDELVTGFVKKEHAVKISKTYDHLNEAFQNQLEALKDGM